jgi:hypothetical protein
MNRSSILWGLGGAVAAFFLTVTLVPSQSPTAGPIPPAAPLTVPPAGPATPTAPKEPAAKTIDELLSQLDAIKAQKTALEKAEQETVALLVEKLKQQRQRLQKLGINPEGQEHTPYAPPPASATPSASSN